MESRLKLQSSSTYETCVDQSKNRYERSEVEEEVQLLNADRLSPLIFISCMQIYTEYQYVMSISRQEVHREIE